MKRIAGGVALGSLILCAILFAPHARAAGCDFVSFEGCCYGQIVYFCDGNEINGFDCTESPSCGWQTEGDFYDCGTPGVADPTGQHQKDCPQLPPMCGDGACADGETHESCPNDCQPEECGGVSFQGCCLEQVFYFCGEDGDIHLLNCAENLSCGWNAEGGHYDCGTQGKPDPSGLHPLACSNMPPMCGDGACDEGEDPQICPTDCTGSVCGDQICQEDETTETCDQDCVGCKDKECGFDEKSNPCGECPADQFCNLAFKCQPSDPTEPVSDIVAQVEPEPEPEIVAQPEITTQPDTVPSPEPGPDSTCMPHCQYRVCGPDGCGGSCGLCPYGYHCTEAGLCNEEPWYDVTYQCPKGMTSKYGTCVDDGTGDDQPAGGCSAGNLKSPPPPGAALLLLLLLALLPFLRLVAGGRPGSKPLAILRIWIYCQPNVTGGKP